MPSELGSGFGGGGIVGGGGTGGGRPIKKFGSGGASNGPPRVGDPPATESATGATPGGYDLNPLDPIATSQGVIAESEGLIAGIKNAIFGASQADYSGQHGGLLGDVPIVGGLGRGAGEAVAAVASPVLGAAGEAGSAALNLAGGAAEHVDLGSDEEHAQLQKLWEQVPDDRPDKIAAMEQMKNDPGAAGHYMAVAVNAWKKERMAEGDLLGEKPSAYGDVYKVSGSAAEGFDNILGFLMNTPRAGHRTLVGFQERIPAIMAAGDSGGAMKFNPDQGILGTGFLKGEHFGEEMTPTEAIIYSKIKSGEWDEDDGLDFLLMMGEGQRSLIGNIGAEVALDPANLVSLGTAAVGKVAVTGAKLSSAALAAERVVQDTRALKLAAEAAGHTDDALKLADDLIEAEKKLEIAQGALKQGTSAAKLNPLGQAARSEKMTNMVRRMYTVYEPLQDLHVTKALHYARGIIDPLGVITAGNPFKKKMLSLISDDAARIVIGAYGNGNHAKLLHDLADVRGADALLSEFSQDLGDYSGNVLRRVIARSEREAALTTGRAKDLMKKNVTEHMADLGDEVRIGSHEEGVLLEANRFRIRDGEWDDAAYANLAQRMADNYGYQTAEEWQKWLQRGDMNADKLSMVHAATYARAWRRLRTAVNASEDAGEGLLDGKLSRTILINRRTLTDVGAEGILSRLAAYKSTAARLKYIEKMQELYPELRGFSLDYKKKVDTVDRFMAELERTKEALPHQLLDDELATLPDELRALHDDVFTLGLAPPDEFKWGIRRSNAAGGELAPTHDVWVDHVVSDMDRGFLPVGTRIEQNILGQPIPGAAKQLLRATDYIDAGARTLGRRVTGQIIVESARAQFISDATTQYQDVGITHKIATDIMDALDEAVANQDLVVRPVGMTGGTIWDIAKTVIPKNIPQSQFGRREVVDLLWRAYEGDLRYVGVTQKLSNRIKRMLAFEGNTAGFLAEGVYPYLKFRINMAFQFQEKLEPWILNALRGVSPAGSYKHMNAADKVTYDLLDRMAQRSLVSNADYEMAEQAGKILHGKNIDDMARASHTSLGKMTQKFGVDWDSIRDVKGLKQVNMLRTFRKGLGKELRQTWDEIEPGTWDAMYQEAVRRTGKGAGGLDEDEFAVMLMAEQMMGSDIKIGAALEGRIEKLAKGFGHVDYRAAIEPGQWASPQFIGEMRALNMDDVAHLLAFEGVRPGTVTKNLGDLQAGIAAGKYTIDDVLDGLRNFNADPDYLMRVRSNLEFSYEGFWRQVGKDFNLDAEGIAKYQGVIDRMAALRGMKPAEYLSQMLIPTIGRGKVEPVIGHLGELIRTFDEAGDVLTEKADLAQLFVRAKGEGTEDEFVNQLSSIYAAHLDPSAKLRIIEAFNPEVKARIADMNDISLEHVEEHFWTPEVQEQFQRMILGEVNVPEGNLGDLYEAGKLRTVEEWDRVDPVQDIIVRRDDGQIIRMPPGSRLVGDGLRAASPAVKSAILRTIGDLRAQFPDVPLRQMDIVEPDMLQNFLLGAEDAKGIAAGVFLTDDGGVVVLMNKNQFGDDWESVWGPEADFQRRSVQQLEGIYSNSGPRESVIGARESLADNPVETVRHEFGHVVHEHVKLRLGELRKAGKGKTKEARLLNKILKFEERFEGSLGRVRLTEYANRTSNEGMAELLSLIMGGGDARAMDMATAEGAAAFLRGEGAQVIKPVGSEAEDLIAAVPDFQTVDHLDEYLSMIDNGEYDLKKLDAILLKADDAEQAGDDELVSRLLSEAHDEIEALKVPARDSGATDAYTDDQLRAIIQGDKDIPDAGLGYRDVAELAKGPQSVEEAATELRQLLLDAGVMKPKPENIAGAVPQDPELIRYANWFGKWTNAAFGEFFQHGMSASQASALGKIAGMPTTDAAPFDMTQNLLMTTAIENMKAKFDDAWRLQYYSRGRTMLERSVNHPLFGIYPASYMWGKMLPEMIRFLAKEPFGVRTAAPAYTTMDVMSAVAQQREIDPSVDEQMEKLGHNPALFGLSYMMPSFPWEVSASWPGYVREFGQQGLDLQARIEGGGLAATPAASSGINLPEVGGKITDLMNPLLGPQRMFGEPLEEINPPNLEPAAIEGGPVAATELGDPLNDALNSLRSLFGG